MKNKKSILNILIILNIIFLVGLIMFVGIKWFENNFDNDIIQEDFYTDLNVKNNPDKKDENFNEGEDNLSKLRPQLNCQEGWDSYFQDVIGIGFCYPKEWGEPYTEPYENMTDISDMKRANKEYYKSFDIRFKEDKSLNLKFFNEQYTGKTERDIDEPYNYYGSGSTGNIIDLKNSNDICDYKVSFKYKYNPTMIPGDLQTIHSDCEKGVKSILTEDKQYFSFVDNDPRYTYKLKSLGFKKLSNHYFDYLLMSDSFDGANQIVEKLNSLDEFFIAKKTNKNTGETSVKTKEQFIQEREIFEKFVNSVVVYDPILKQPKEFKEIKGEDLNITAIRKYYWLIETGKLEDSYAMRTDDVFADFDEFKKDYESVYFVEPFDFKKIGENQYDFQVKYQDHNSDEQIFHNTMEVENNKLKTIFTEEYLTDRVEFNDMIAFATKRGSKNYMVLQKNGKEFIVDEGYSDYNFEDESRNLSEVKFFSNIKFSPKGNYLTYRVGGWEWSYENIYDISKNISITEKNDKMDLYSAEIGFTDDEKYFYFCSSAGMASGPGGQVYSIPNFDLKLDVLKDDRVVDDFIYVDCDFNKNSNYIYFKLFNCDEEYELCNDDDKKVEIKYNLSTGKVE